MAELLFGLHFAACLFLTGLIWVVQVAHYPAFSFVEAERFPEFHRFHVKRISFLVVPMMGLELLSGLALLVWRPAQLSNSVFILSLTLLGVIWAVTWLWSMPTHRALQAGYSRGEHESLVTSNWIRTLGWSMRSLLLSSKFLYLFDQGGLI